MYSVLPALARGCFKGFLNNCITANKQQREFNGKRGGRDLNPRLELAKTYDKVSVFSKTDFYVVSALGHRSSYRVAVEAI